MFDQCGSSCDRHFFFDCVQCHAEGTSVEQYEKFSIKITSFSKYSFHLYLPPRSTVAGIASS